MQVKLGKEMSGLRNDAYIVMSLDECHSLKNQSETVIRCWDLDKSGRKSCEIDLPSDLKRSENINNCSTKIKPFIKKCKDFEIEVNHKKKTLK